MLGVADPAGRMRIPNRMDKPLGLGFGFRVVDLQAYKCVASTYVLQAEFPYRPP